MGRAGGAHRGSADDEDTRLLVAGRTDPLAFRQFYERNSTKLLGYFYARTRCRHTSADLMMETFAEAFKGRRTFDPHKGPAEAWLLAIARNQFRRWARRSRVDATARGHLRIKLLTVAEDDLDHIAEMVDLHTLRDDLHEALAGLSDKVRDAVLLRVGLNLPYEEVAAQLGCSVGTARVRVSRGMDSLLEQAGST